VIKEAFHFHFPLTVLTVYRDAETVETVEQFMITGRGHRAEATVLMRTLRVDP